MVTASLMGVTWAEEVLSGGMHFHGGQEEKMKRDERQTTRSTYIYRPKRGKRDTMLKRKGEDPKERFGKKTFNSVQKPEKSSIISGSCNSQCTSVFGSQYKPAQSLLVQVNTGCTDEIKCLHLQYGKQDLVVT